MKVTRLYAFIALLGAATLATTSCGSAQRPTPLLSKAQSTPPGLKPSTQAKADPPAVVAEAKPADPAPAQTTAPGPNDEVGALIEQVEKLYKIGQDNYHAGHLEAAKQNFDDAFNLLLGSNLDVSTDERLQHELDKVLEGVNSLELQALQEGDGFNEQKSEPAPIDEANSVTFPVDPNIKAKAEAERSEEHTSELQSQFHI